MGETQEHYDSHLGPVYSWMTGDFVAASARSHQLFDALNLQPGTTGIAVDLGCGHGLQALPLAERGFHVYAIDTCERLLRELRERAGVRSLAIDAVLADIEAFPQHVPDSFDVAVCMGDTLTHLPTLDCVANSITEVGRRLVPGGRFVTSFRDYVSVELSGPDRFILVKSDSNRILTCFLEYEDDIVRVHDLIHSKDDGSWTLDASSYQKLRLDIEWIKAQLNAAGLRVESCQTERGMITIAAVAA